MPEPREAAAITQGREEGWHGEEILVPSITPMSQGWRTAGIIGSSRCDSLHVLPEAYGSEALARAPTQTLRGVASTTRSPSGRASPTPLALSWLSPAGSIAAGEDQRTIAAKYSRRGDNLRWVDSGVTPSLLASAGACTCAGGGP